MSARRSLQNQSHTELCHHLWQGEQDTYCRDTHSLTILPPCLPLPPWSTLEEELNYCSVYGISIHTQICLKDSTNMGNSIITCNNCLIYMGNWRSFKAKVDINVLPPFNMRVHGVIRVQLQDYMDYQLNCCCLHANIRTQKASFNHCKQNQTESRCRWLILSWHRAQFHLRWN